MQAFLDNGGQTREVEIGELHPEDCPLVGEGRRGELQDLRAVRRQQKPASIARIQRPGEAFEVIRPPPG